VGNLCSNADLDTPVLTTYERLIGGNVGVSDILAQIDQEIAQLQQARSLLSGAAVSAPKKAAVEKAAKKPTKKKRNLTPEGRKRIAEAVRRRWAEQKKAAAK
jgi:hypothetical protein